MSTSQTRLWRTFLYVITGVHYNRVKLCTKITKLKNMFVITERLLTTEFVIAEFHCSYIFNCSLFSCSHIWVTKIRRCNRERRVVGNDVVAVSSNVVSHSYSFRSFSFTLNSWWNKWRTHTLSLSHTHTHTYSHMNERERERGRWWTRESHRRSGHLFKISHGEKKLKLYNNLRFGIVHKWCHTTPVRIHRAHFQVSDRV